MLNQTISAVKKDVGFIAFLDMYRTETGMGANSVTSIICHMHLFITLLIIRY
jgi:hypothetical protein